MATKTTTADMIVVDRPQVPADYGVPASDEGMLPWSHVVERMTDALNYWVATIYPDGRPHVSVVWGVWYEDRFYFDGSPETRRGRNVAANPSVTVHLESGTDVVILEGVAEEVRHPDHELTVQLAAEYARKYAAHDYAPEPQQWDNGGLFAVTLDKVLAWSSFPADMTRWRFRK